MDNDLISRTSVLELLDREINSSKEMENSCEEKYKAGFQLKQVECQNIKELISYLPSFNENLENIIAELEQFKRFKENEIQRKWECSKERASHVAFCTSEEYQNAKNVINIIKKYCQIGNKEDAQNANPAN